MRRKLLAVLFCAALMLQLAVPAGAAGSVYFTAVNKNVLELSDATMPFWSGGYLYVPADIFTGSNRDLQVGLTTTSSGGGTTLLLYGGSAEFQTLSFDLSKDYAVDKNGNMYFQKAIQRGGVTFLPISLVARVFDLLYTVIEVSRGYLVWVRTHSADMSERIFADAASYQMESRYSQYVKEQGQGDVSEAESPDDTAQAASGQRVYLCLEAADGSAVSALLDALDQYGSQAAFYCTVDFLEQEGALLRRMTATGQAVGILADAAAGPTVAEQLAAGNAALEAATCGRTRLAKLENVSDQTAAEVERMGYVCLWEDLDRSPYPLTNSSAAEVLARRVSERGGSVTVWLGDGADAAGLRAFLADLRQSGDRCLALTETT
jgi:peptidoglycan/xylan/chitin deacetylase (PgdA/CDA1 family)